MCHHSLQTDRVTRREIDVQVNRFKDYKGRRPAIHIVNRVLARAEKGEILNLDCQPTNYDPKRMVWAYDLGTRDNITIKYKAPDQSCTEDIIKVWNSCEVKWDPPKPFIETVCRDVTGQATIKISCTKIWSGTVSYQRNISWTDRQPTSTGYAEFTRQLSESATLNLSFGYSHTYSDSGGTLDYYDQLVTAQGNYSVMLKSIDHLFDEKHGDWTKIEEKVTASGGLEEVSGMLTVNSDAGTYELHLDFASPECTGTSVTTSSSGGRFGR